MKALAMLEGVYLALLRHPGRVIAAGFLLFAIKRTVNLWIDGYVLWLASDYAMRIALLLLCVRYIEAWPAPGRPNPLSRTAASVVLIVVIVPADFLLRVFFAIYPVRFADPLSLWSPPFITSNEVQLFDLTVGLVLVAVSEELFFRKILYHYLLARGFRPLSAVLLGSAMFALVHLTSGTIDVLCAFGYGLLFSGLYVFSRRIWPGAACHWAANFFAAAFAGMK